MAIRGFVFLVLCNIPPMSGPGLSQSSRQLILDTGSVSPLYLVTVACSSWVPEQGLAHPTVTVWGYSGLVLRHNHLPQPPFLILIFLLASRFCILISPETRTVCESHDAAGTRSEYDVPRDLEQEIHKIPETSQSLQRLLTHHLHHPHLLLRCSHELLSHHEGNLF